MKKVILGGLLGGLALFIWGSISHMALPLGNVGIRVIPPSLEPAVLGAMKGAMTERAIYFFPGMNMTSATEEEQKAWLMKYEAGPAGIVVFDPKPTGRMPTQLALELVGNMLAALLAAVVILRVPAAVGFLPRALLVALFGLVETFDVDLSQWNWYGFPTTYFLAQLVDHTVGWFLAGLVLARICKE